MPVSHEVLAWALDRSKISPTDKRYDTFAQWADGSVVPTFSQLKTFARATHAPLGYLFLDQPPVEDFPIPDFRTVGNAGVSAPSPDLLDTIYECQARQDWYRAYATLQNFPSLPFVGSATVSDPVDQVADEIRTALGFEMSSRAEFSNWEQALRQLIYSIEELGVLVMVSGIVGSNTHRKLDPREFRGFALSDPSASLIFVNGADTKAAQIFTMVHELAHLWLGETALSDARMAEEVTNSHELWANQVAAEVLVPLTSILNDYQGSADVAELERLAKLYKVSTLVVLKRIFDAGFLPWKVYRSLWETERTRVLAIVASKAGSGGNYYYTQPIRLSATFARAVIVDAKEGRTLYRDAFELLGAAKRATFEGLASQLGVG